jgi:D-alanyl-D-alanine carboxypeptidase/D-alanyl-D-alanine-endopeptidase (penicillin-binding protein 4)
MVCLTVLFMCEAGYPSNGPNLKLPGIRSQDAAVVVSGQGNDILALNPGKKCIPASTIKILTALAALHHMGDSFRFETSIYLDESDNLFVKGWGDPLLISEVIDEISAVIAKKIGTIEDLVLDESHFSKGIEIPGRERSLNPYDAPVGALCANFNTVFFRRGKKGNPVSSEPQTPLVDFALARIKRSDLPEGRHSFMNDSGEAALYFGHLLAHFLKTRGIEVRGAIRTGIAPKRPPFHVHISRYTLVDILEKMMEYSNNFIANQLAISLGARLYGPPGTIDKAAEAISSFGRGKLGLKSLRVVEGSGISRENNITPADMIEVLNGFEPHRKILKRRGDILYKSGTLRGIQSRAGYLELPGQRPCRFAIFLDGSLANIDAMMDSIAKGAQRP